MAVDVGSAKGYLDLDISGFLNGLRTAQTEADSKSKNIATTVGTNLSGIGKGLTSAGTTLTKNVTVPVLGIGIAGLKVATDFEKGMSEVKAISGATGKDFDALRNKAIELGADTAFSSTEVAAAMTEMAKAGWGPQQIIDGMGGVLAAAAASGEGLASVSTIVADSITGFGLAAGDSTMVADLLTQAANSGTIGIADLGETFKYIAPVAGAMGLSIQDVTTAVSAMSMSGIKGSQAGTALRTMLTNLVNPSDDAAAVMQNLGISAVNADGSMKSLDEIVANLRTSFSGLTEAEKAEAAAMLAGKTGMSGMLALLNLTDEEYNAIAESMDNAGGVAEQTAAIMQDNLKSKVEQLGGALESLAIKLADLVLPYIQQFVVWLTSLVDKFTALDPETQKTILKFVGLAAAAGPLILILGKLVTATGSIFTAFGKIPGAITTVKTGFTGLTTAVKNVGEGFKLTKAGFPGFGAEASKLGSALAGVTGPMIAIVAAIALVSAAFISLWKNNEEFRNNITAIWTQIKETFSGFADGIVERINSLGFNFKSITDVIKAIWEAFCNFLAPIFTGVFQQISNAFKAGTDLFLNILDFWISIFKGDWEGAWNAIKGIFETVWNAIKSFFSNILNTIKGVLNVVLGWFGTSWSECWNGIKTFFENLWNGIATWFQTTLNNIVTFFTTTWTSVSTFFTGIWEGISSWFKTALNNIVTFFTTNWTNVSTFFSNLWNGISSFLQTAWDTIKNIVQVGIMFIVELFSAAFQLITLPFKLIWENCKETITTIWDSIKTTVSNTINGIKTTISTVWNNIKTALQPILDAIKTTITNIWNGIKTTITNVLNGVKTTVTNIWNGIKTAVTNTINSVKTTVTNVFNSIKTSVTNIWNGIKTAISNAINSAKTTITNVFNSVKTSVTNVWNGIKTAISNTINSIKTTVSNVFNSVKTSVTTVWNNIKSAITGPINSAKSTISSVINSIKSTISSGFNSAKSTVTSVFNSIKTSISSALNSAKTTVSNVISKIKGLFNFSWSLPKLKMPHFSVTGSFSLNPPSVPKLSISWYKKAMSGGMILNGATIFGMDNNGNLLGGGEAGSETVVGTESLMRMIRKAVTDAIKPFVDITYQLARASVELGYITHNGFVKQKQMEEKFFGVGGNKDNGDTFIFNSPKPIDEIEAARQMKKTKRELAEGF